MRALVSTRKGPPDTLEVVDLPAPAPGPGEALVAVRAAALNYFDTLIIEDRYQHRPERPFSPGGEMAGVVESLGPDVVEVAPGDRVIGYLGHGCCREKVVVPARQLFPLAGEIPFETGAGLVVTYGTTLHALRDRAGLQPGERLAVLGASGGTGQAAVEIGRLMGAEVIACASSEEKLAAARALGAHHGIVYDAAAPEGARAFKDALRAATGGEGVDVVYDPVGGDLAEAAIRSLAWLGRYLVIGFTAGIPRIPLNLLLLKGADVRGVFWGEWTRRDPDGFRALVTQIVEWTAAAELKATVDSVFPLERAAEGLERLAARKAIGKVVIVP